MAFSLVTAGLMNLPLLWYVCRGTTHVTPKGYGRATGTRTQYGESLVIEGKPPSLQLNS